MAHRRLHTLLHVILFGVCFGLVVLPAAARSQETAEPRAGLMWHHSGLPAVFPLQLRTPPGSDYYVRLFEPETDRAVLAAFMKGGSFFRVLVPPGRYDLRFAWGETWIDERELFGAGNRTRLFALDQPLRFAIRDFATKAGHLVDITFSDDAQEVQVAVTAQFICQGARIASFPRLQPPFEDGDPYRFRIPDDDQLRRFPSRYSQERLLDSGEEATFPTRYAPYLSAPEYELRGVPC
ncbi:hypothetical protein ROLI_000840 [Roseobacter fucihabitans]|uniref:DUF2846 domain-containing protein n=1 Tax=Roseobacter fucihabitans TaxID=1537242 RepID=A0ABZ2BLK3_9RHOB|nr:hypothetical protein [Roseobacter litoralis]MBC6966457.1 hypothetical protein [Roseobacter litoralis]